MIGQNTKKSHGDFRRLAVTQTPVRNPSVNAGVKKCFVFILKYYK